MTFPHSSGGPAGRPTFQPRFALGLLYTMAICFASCLLFIAPDLYAIWSSMPADPAMQEEAFRVAREVVRPRLPLALGAGTLVTLVCVRVGVLPGLRRAR